MERTTVMRGGTIQWSDRSARLPLLLCVIALWTADTVGQCPYRWSETFAAPRLLAKDMVVFDDGSGPSLHAVGSFAAAGAVAAAGVAKWDGSHWAAVSTALSANGSVNTCTVWDDGSGAALWVGGAFSSIGGIAAQSLAKWNGSTWTAVSPGVIGTVHDLEVHDDGSGPALYVGGAFSVPGLVSPNLARHDGAAWTPIAPGVVGAVFALTVWNDTSGEALFVGGSFTVAAAAVANIGKWDGTAWSPVGGGLAGTVQALLSFTSSNGDDHLYVGGNFTHAGSFGLARWNAMAWSALPGVTLVHPVSTLTRGSVGSQSALYVGLDAPPSATEASSGVFAWNGQGVLLLGGGVTGGTAGGTRLIESLAVHDDGAGPRLFASGDFTASGSARSNGMAAWDGTAWSRVFGDGIGGPVFALERFGAAAAPDLYAGGSFSVAGDAAARNVARFDGQSWSALGSGANGSVFAMTTHDDGSGPALWVGGAFTGLGGLSGNGVARFDGAVWSGVGPGLSGSFPGPTTVVFALAAYESGPSGPLLVAGGNFLDAGGILTPFIAAWNGAAWLPLGSGMNDFVTALAVFDDGSGPALYAGGVFTSAGGVPGTMHVAKWNGSAWSALGSGTNGPVLALSVFDDGNGAALYAGGSFSLAGGVSVKSLARWSGSAWTDVAGGVANAAGFPGVVSALRAFDDGRRTRLWIGGGFSDAGGLMAQNVASFDGATWFVPQGPVASTSGSAIYALAAHDTPIGPRLYAGGAFTTTSQSLQLNIAAWEPDAESIACPRLGPCAGGNVGASAGGPFDILLVNGRHGGLSRRVNVGFTDGIIIDVMRPPTLAGPAAFALFAYFDAASAGLEAVLPLGVGVSCFPICAPGFGDPAALTVADNFGLSPLVCAPLLPSAPAPWSLAIPAVPVFVRITLQGVIQDPSRPLGIGVSNAVVLVVGN